MDAVEGSNVPAEPLVIPVPLHVPPVAPVSVSVIGDEFEQIGDTDAIEGTPPGLTVTFCVKVALHGPHVMVSVTG